MVYYTILILIHGGVTSKKIKHNFLLKLQLVSMNYKEYGNENENNNNKLLNKE